MNNRDHGGNIDWAQNHFGGAPDKWVDLSTGINRVAYPIPNISHAAWAGLPTKTAMHALKSAAADAYETDADILPVAGAQAAIQMIPLMVKSGSAKILGPTYNEHAASLISAGWSVEMVTEQEQLAGADLAVVVNPNNPNGHECEPEWLLQLSENVGQLLVDESFADSRPDISVAPFAGAMRNLFVLRSFGKFYGLAGVRLGFILGHSKDIEHLAEMAGPWPISGAAIEIGVKALRDYQWAEKTTARLRGEVSFIDKTAKKSGWQLIGGTDLFRLYETPNAEEAQNNLAKHYIWSRIFPWSESYIRLGLPGTTAEWGQLESAFSEINKV